MKASSKHVWLGLLALALSACVTSGKPKPPNPSANPLPSATSSTAAAKSTVDKPAEPAQPIKDPDTRFKEALAALKAKNQKDAREGFSSLAKDYPAFTGPLTNLGIIDAKAGSREAAISELSRAVVAEPRNAIAYNWLGILYREAKDYSRAEQAYRKALTIRSDYAVVHLNLGILYDAYLNHPGQALAEYREYQQQSGNKELKIVAWIKALETSGAVVPAAPVSAQPAPAAGAKKKS